MVRMFLIPLRGWEDRQNRVMARDSNDDERFGEDDVSYQKGRYF
ncbi:MAG: hypothetical protein ACUVUR_05805 [bacterium]